VGGGWGSTLRGALHIPGASGSGLGLGLGMGTAAGGGGGVGSGGIGPGRPWTFWALYGRAMEALLAYLLPRLDGSGNPTTAGTRTAGAATAATDGTTPVAAGPGGTEPGAASTPRGVGRAPEGAAAAGGGGGVAAAARPGLFLASVLGTVQQQARTAVAPLAPSTPVTAAAAAVLAASGMGSTSSGAHIFSSRSVRLSVRALHPLGHTRSQAQGGYVCGVVATLGRAGWRWQVRWCNFLWW
jgi:hypothetical protein